MKHRALWILPSLLVSIFFLQQSGVLDISYIKIKTHELKWTLLDYSYHPKDGDIFTIGQTVSNFNYEDALIAIQPSYDQLLYHDVEEISEERDYIDFIDPIEKSLYTDDYIIQLCLDKEYIEIKDSTIFRTIGNLEILGYYELYNRNSGELLYKVDDEKWWIRDKMTFYGISSRSFIKNKIDEIWLAQVSNEASSFVEEYERPGLLALSYYYSPEYADQVGEYFEKIDQAILPKKN